MADDDKESGRSGGLGAILFPWRKVKNLDPRKVIGSRISGQRDIGSSYGFAVSALKKSKASGCPQCGATRSVSLLEAVPSDSGDKTYILGCSECDYVENVEMKLDAVRKTIDGLRTGERRFLIAAGFAAAFGFLYYFMTGYLFTLVGAMLIATIILMNAMVFRYRVWQLVHHRLYETKAPLGDWLRYEFSNSGERHQ